MKKDEFCAYLRYSVRNLITHAKSVIHKNDFIRKMNRIRNKIYMHFNLVCCLFCVFTETSECIKQFISCHCWSEPNGGIGFLGEVSYRPAVNGMFLKSTVKRVKIQQRSRIGRIMQINLVIWNRIKSQGSTWLRYRAKIKHREVVGNWTLLLRKSMILICSYL